MPQNQMDRADMIEYMKSMNDKIMKNATVVINQNNIIHPTATFISESLSENKIASNNDYVMGTPQTTIPPTASKIPSFYFPPLPKLPSLPNLPKLPNLTPLDTQSPLVSVSPDLTISVNSFQTISGSHYVPPIKTTYFSGDATIVPTLNFDVRKDGIFIHEEDTLILNTYSRKNIILQVESSKVIASIGGKKKTLTTGSYSFDGKDITHKK